jgi:hypothetical protein
MVKAIPTCRPRTTTLSSSSDQYGKMFRKIAFNFVLAAHRERSSLHASTLRRWLIEIEGWAPDVAEQLAIDYEYGRELLVFAEGRRSA